MVSGSPANGNLFIIESFIYLIYVSNFWGVHVILPKVHVENVMTGAALQLETFFSPLETFMQNTLHFQYRTMCLTSATQFYLGNMSFSNQHS